MLALRRDWHTVHAGAVANDLVAQAPGRRLRVQVASSLVAASLDLLVAALPRRTAPPLEVKTLSPLAWQIWDFPYMYLPPNDDGAMGACIRLARRSEVTVILARPYEALKRRLLMAALRKRSPSMLSFDVFIALKTDFAAIDQHWPRGRAVRELLLRYNRRISAAQQRDLLMVEIPERSE